MKYHYFTLANGLRIALLNKAGVVTHCGLVVGCGSRDEQDGEHGVAHLIEHLLFKGTKTRSMFHILNSLDAVGGELNAFTSKEETWIHASVGSDFFEKAVEVIADIAHNSTFPSEEIKREKVVIEDEINSYKDQPGEMIFEEFERMIYGNHSLGNSILGTEISLSKLSRKSILQFYQKYYRPENSVFAIVGQCSVEQVKEIAIKYFGTWKKGQFSHKRIKPRQIKSKSENVTTENHQAHYLTGTRTYGVENAKNRIIALITNYIGGPALNSRLSYELREKNGIAYHIEANYQAFVHSGIFSIYAGTSEKSLDKMEKLIWKELRLLGERKTTAAQLKAMKKQMCGQFLLTSESGSAEMFHMARSLLLYNKIETHEEIIQSITAISLADFQNESEKLFQKEAFSTLIYV